MEGEVITWLVAIPMLGFATGLRTMTPVAVLCWYGWLGELSPLPHNWLWITKLVTPLVFTFLAAGELVGDKLPFIPDRISPFPLIARLAFGGLCGAISAASLHGPGLEGVVLGVLGAVIGAFVGYMVRRELVSSCRCPDWQIALAEDVLAISMAIFAGHIVAG